MYIPLVNIQYILIFIHLDIIVTYVKQYKRYSYLCN